MSDQKVLELTGCTVEEMLYLINKDTPVIGVRNGASAPARKVYDLPERRLNGAYKVSQMHLPPPNLPRFGGGERPPILCKSIVQRTITMGRRRGVRKAAAVR